MKFTNIKTFLTYLDSLHSNRINGPGTFDLSRRFRLMMMQIREPDTNFTVGKVYLGNDGEFKAFDAFTKNYIISCVKTKDSNYFDVWVTSASNEVWSKAVG